MLAGRSEKPVEVKAPEAPQMASTDILVAKNDIPMGQAVSPGDIQWQAWPAATAAASCMNERRLTWARRLPRDGRYITN